MTTVIEKELTEQPLVLERSAIKGELDTFQYAPPTETENVVFWRRYVPSPLLLLLVILPLLVGVAYNFVIASDRYVSSASFVVRQNRSGNGMLSMIDGSGLSRSDDNSYAVVEFMQSRDAIAYINRDGMLSKIFADPVVDALSQFPSVFTGNSGEDLYKHFQHYLNVDFDSSTGITTLDVQGFSPEQAQVLATRLVAGSEALVNALNERAQIDSVTFAESLVSEAEQRLHALQREMTEFRNEAQVLSVDAEVAMSSGLISGLMLEASKVDMQLSQLSSSTPDSPRIKELRLRREAVQQQLGDLRRSLGGKDDSIALKLERYEEISLQKEIAEKNLVSAAATLVKARQDSAVDRLYVDNIVSPNLPDKYGYPQRFNNIIMIFFVGFSLFIIVRSVRDLIVEGD